MRRTPDPEAAASARPCIQRRTGVPALAGGTRHERPRHHLQGHRDRRSRRSPRRGGAVV